MKSVRTCSVCGFTKELEENFYIRSKSADGSDEAKFYTVCKQCIRFQRDPFKFAKKQRHKNLKKEARPSPEFSTWLGEESIFC